MSAEDYLPLLKRSHLFYGLTDEQMLAFAQCLKPEKHAPKQIIFKQAEAGTHLYFIERGCIKVVRQEAKTLRTLATYEAGDHFGLAALLEDKPRWATVVAETETHLLRLAKADVLSLLKRYPQIRPNLQADLQTQKLSRQMKFAWLMPAEVIYLIARRHPVLLAQRLVLPGLLALGLIIGGLGLYPSAGLAATLTAMGLGAAAVGFWAWWKWMDWGNDFYIVTNRRVVYLEKVVGIYDSRQESPLTSILSVHVQSSDALARALDLGDVIVRTFSGPIVMDSVPRPKALAGLVEEHWRRAKQGARQAEQETVRETVRRTLQPAPAPAPAKPPAASPAPRKMSTGERLARFFSLRVRFEEGDFITYRKHWYLLFKHIWLPTVLSVLFLVGLGIVGFQFGRLLAYKPLLLGLGAVALLGCGLWWLYEFMDWRNDIYQIATDQILDIHRKPLGKETRKAAPLGNVLSLRYERVGVLGLLLNFGTVIATIGNAEFRFEGVYDPKGVQNDIYRRMEALTARKAQADADKRRDELSMWIGTYHATVSEAREPEAPRPPAVK